MRQAFGIRIVVTLRVARLHRQLHFLAILAPDLQIVVLLCQGEELGLQFLARGVVGLSRQSTTSRRRFAFLEEKKPAIADRGWPTT